MKKLITIVAVAMMAIAAEAASFSWTLAKDDAKTYGNRTVYVVDGSNYSAIVAALDAGGSSVSDVFSGYVATSVQANSRGAASDGATTISGTTAAWFIFENDSIADGSKYDTTGAVDVSSYLYTPPASAPADMEMSVGSFAITGKSVGSGSVPEPTTGLLVLLGMAGLALKRKVA